MIRRAALLSLAAVLALAAAPAAAHSGPYYGPQPSARPLTLGGALRVGLDSPSGPMYSGERLANQFGSQLGIMGELGVRVTPEFLFGGYLGLGIGGAGPRFDSACGAGADCASASVRAGLLAQYDFAPRSPVSPWIGYGFGFAAATAGGDDSLANFSYSYVGIELGHLMAGIDFRPGGRVGLGLYADWTFGVYRRYHWDEFDVTVQEGSVREPTVHQWFSVGPRLSF